MQTKHFFKQKAILGYSIACVILLIVFFCIARCTFLRKSVRIIYDETILPCKTVVNPCNQQQSEASVWMNVIDDKLYFYPHCGSTLDRSVYDGYLSVFDKGYVKKSTNCIAHAIVFCLGVMGIICIIGIAIMTAPLICIALIVFQGKIR